MTQRFRGASFNLENDTLFESDDCETSGIEQASDECCGLDAFIGVEEPEFEARRVGKFECVFERMTIDGALLCI